MHRIYRIVRVIVTTPPPISPDWFVEGILLILCYSYLTFTRNAAFGLSPLTLSIVTAVLYRIFIRMPKMVDSILSNGADNDPLILPLLLPIMSTVILLFALDGTQGAQHVTTAFILLSGAKSFACLVFPSSPLGKVCGGDRASHLFRIAAISHVSTVAGLATANVAAIYLLSEANWVAFRALQPILLSTISWWLLIVTMEHAE